MFETISSDLKRLSPSGKASPRTVIVGLLSQGFQAMLVYRLFNWLHQRGISGQPLRFFCERFIEITTGISIPACCKIGKGLRIHHFGGIIFHPTVKLGNNCTLYHGVTIGDRGGSGNAALIGDNVLIGAGAKIIGEITIGDNCIVGSNAVVTKNMPSDTVAVGSPCQFKARTIKEPLRPECPPAAKPIPRIMDFRGTYKGGGGPDKTVLNSAARHDPAKVHVLVTYLRQPEDIEFQIPEMARRLGINYVDVQDGGLLDRSCLSSLKEILIEHQLGVIHAHDEKTLLYAWLLTFMMPDLKIMYTCHSHPVYGREAFASILAYLKFKLRQKVQIFLMRRYQKPIITVSHDTKNRLILNGLDGKDVAVLHNGIDFNAWQPSHATPSLRKELHIPGDGFLVGMVARITYDKDLPTFYRVAQKVATQVSNVTFVIVGDGNGNELEKAREEVESRGLETLIRFTGHRTDLTDVYSSLDVFLMTSLTEGLPNTLLEAMSMSVPSVSTAVGGVPELLEAGKCGFLAPVGDAEALAGHVITLLQDPLLRERYGAASRKRVEDHFSFDRRVRLMEDYYSWFAGAHSLPALNEMAEQTEQEYADFHAP
jgi:glycosyltransferase involved in cell wall biosynthesis/serine acetyltransferase